MTKIKDEVEELFEELLNEDFKNEILQEQTIVENYDGLNIAFEPNGETNRGWSNDPYFKVYKKNKTMVARIYITRPKYCKPHKGAKVFYLNGKEKESLIKALSDNNYKNWKTIVRLTGDYMKSKENKSFPSDLPMPDYMKL